MFGKGFPACLLGRLGSVTFLFLATSVAFSSLAFAAKIVPAQKTDWIYFDLYFTPQTATPCLSTDTAMANAVLARINKCESSFSQWTSAWPDSEGLTPWTPLCVAPGIPPSEEHWQHMESRVFEYNYKNTCPGTTNTSSAQVTRHFYYYCADPENYYLVNSASGVACHLKSDKQDTDKQPHQEDCCNVGNPINVATGQKYQRETDYLGTPLRFERHYWNRAWRTTYSRQVAGIYEALDGVVLVRRDDGRAFTFQRSGANTYGTDPDVNSKLERLLDAGVRIGWRYTDEEHTVELYDADGRLTSITTRSGLVQTLTYDVDDRLATVTDSFGKQLTFGYDGAGRLATLTDPAGGTFQYGYAPNGDLATVTAPDLSVRSYLYNEAAHTGGADLPHALTGITDENNDRFATFKYDSSGRAVQTEHAGGADRTIVAYNADGTRTITDALGTARIMTTVLKQGVAKPSTVTGPGCGSCGLEASYTYDANGNRTHEYDWKGIWKTYRAFSSDGRNLETLRDEPRTATLQRRTTTAWHATYRIPTQIDEPGRRTSFTHDANGNVLTKTVLATATSESRTWTYTYNSVGRVLTENGPRTDVSDLTTYAYYNCTTGDECGQVHTITNALGHVTTYNTYNAHGQPLTITDPNGVVTTLAYDARQRLTSSTVGTEQTTFTYWPTGLLKKATLPDGSFLEHTYDAAHRLSEIVDSEGNRIVYTLDAMGNRTAENVYDPSSVLTQTRTRVFNTLNQLSQEIAAAGSAAVTTTFTYDANSNQTGINEPLSRNTVQAFDELNRLKQVTDPLSGITKYGYSAFGELSSVTDPRNKVTTYTYNGLGDLKQQISPDTGTTNNTYDSGGNLQSSTDARSKTATYAYDALNRVTSVTYPDQTIGYTYDSGSNQTGRLSQVSDASGSTGWSYDTHGRVLSRQQSMGVTKTVGYAYDSVGRLQTVTLPSGNTITYGYTDDKIASLTLNGSTTILSNVLHQPFGPTRGWTWGNSTIAVREYDTDGKITDIDSAGLKSYGYDDAFRITGITDAANSSLSQSYGYDLLDRLTSATGTSLSQGWTYDANSNRLTQTGSAASTYTVSGTSNRLTSITGALTRTYSYDNAGNTTNNGTATSTYNDAGRLVSATKAGVTTTYALNALGQRVKKTTGGSSTYFVYDDEGHLVGEYDNAGSLVQETVWLGDISVATLRPSGGGGVSHFYVHADHLDTPRRISRPSDNIVVWRWDSDPFGSSAANEDPDGDSNPFVYNLRFPGQYFDTETGLHYNYFRDYDQAVGRYPQSDPIGLDGGLNTYAYVDSNPVHFADPLGLVPGDVFGTREAAEADRAIFAALLDERRSALDVVLSRLAGPDRWDWGYLTDAYQIDRTDETSCSNGFTYDWIDYPDPNVGFPPGVGPSGKPMLHFVKHATRKRAKDAARYAGKGAPMHHPSPRRGNPHYHPVDGRGRKIPGTHHDYPR